MRREIFCCVTVRCNVGDWTTMESITFPITTIVGREFASSLLANLLRKLLI